MTNYNAPFIMNFFKKASAITLLFYGILIYNAVIGQELELPKIPIAQAFETNDYSGGTQNWKVSENEKGYLYIANNFGVLEYDGSRWSLFKIDNSTRSTSIYVDPNSSRIYVGGQNSIGYLEPNYLGHLVFHSLIDLIPQGKRSFDDVWDILEINGKIIFSTVHNLFIYNQSTIEAIEITQSSGFSFRIDNQIITYSEELGLVALVENELKVVHTLLPEVKSVNGIIKESESALLIFTAYNGILRLNSGTLEVAHEDLSAFLKSAIINTAIRLSSGDLAIGTQNKGLIILSSNGKMKYHLDKGSGLSNRTVLSLYEDRFKNLWVGLNNGLNYLELNSPFAVIDERSNLPGTGYHASNFQNKVYFGTSNGLHYFEKNNQEFDKRVNFVQNSEGQVYNLYSITGKLYSAHHEGAFQIRGNEAIPLFEGGGTWKHASLPGNPSLVLGGTYNGFYTFSQVENGVPKSFSPIKGLTESSRVFEIDHNGNVWMTHGYKGVFKLQFDSGYSEDPVISYYGSNSGFPSNILINVFKIGGELIFAAESGAYRYQESTDSFSIDSTLTRLIGEGKHISFLQEDALGNIYFIASEEVGVLKRSSLGQYEMEVQPFKKINHLLSDNLENISLIDHHNILIGARDGFIHYDPLFNIENTKETNAVISKIDVFGDSTFSFRNLKFSKDFKFQSTFNHFIFYFASPNFASIENLEYTYLLEGFAEDWSQFTPEKSKEYTNLPPGDYKFRLKVKDIYGHISKETSFEFSILPPWYKTYLAYVAYVILSLGVFGISLFTVDRKHRVQRKKSEINQKRQLISKDNKIQEVTKKSEERITELRNEKLKVEINHKNKELATTTMHLLQRNEFMNGMKDRLKNALQTNKDSKKEIRDVIREIERNSARQEDWRHFEMHFDVVHSEFLKKIKEQYADLTQQDIKLSAFLKMNMSTKEIANLLNISVRGVEISRYRLRKKLGLDRETNLVEFMMNFDSNRNASS